MTCTAAADNLSAAWSTSPTCGLSELSHFTSLFGSEYVNTSVIRNIGCHDVQVFSFSFSFLSFLFCYSLLFFCSF